VNRGPIRWYYEGEDDCWVARIGQLELLRIGDEFLRRCGEGIGLEETRSAALDGRVDFVAEANEHGGLWVKRILNPTCNDCGAAVGPMVARWMGVPDPAAAKGKRSA